MRDEIEALELTKVDNGRLTYYRVTLLGSHGYRHEGVPINTVEQAQERARQWYPNAVVRVVDEDES